MKKRKQDAKIKFTFYCILLTFYLLDFLFFLHILSLVILYNFYQYLCKNLDKRCIYLQIMFPRCTLSAFFKVSENLKGNFSCLQVFQKMNKKYAEFFPMGQIKKQGHFITLITPNYCNTKLEEN